MILQLRLIKGVSVLKANEKFGVDILTIFKNELDKLQNLKLIEIIEETSSEFNQKDTFIRLTHKGLDLANIVWEEFI